MAFKHVVCSTNKIKHDSLKILYVSECDNHNDCSLIKNKHYHLIVSYSSSKSINLHNLIRHLNPKNRIYRTRKILYKSHLKKIVQSYSMVKFF